MENNNVIILCIGLVVLSLFAGAGLSSLGTGHIKNVQQFEAMDVAIHAGKPNVRLYTFKLQLDNKADFFFFVDHYNVTEVWIKRGIVPYFYCVMDGVMYWW